MPFDPETLALAKALGIEIAGPDHPIYSEPATVILRPAGRGSTPSQRPLTKAEAMDQSCERILSEAAEAMRSYCGLPSKGQ
jgi:hypothetical protein